MDKGLLCEKTKKMEASPSFLAWSFIAFYNKDTMGKCAAPKCRAKKRIGFAYKERQ